MFSTDQNLEDAKRPPDSRREFPFDSPGQSDLGRRTTRSGAITIAGQGVRFGLSFLSTVVLARILVPEDFGLVAMVTAITGLLRIFRDGGLARVTIQRQEITHAQVSTLFWLNLALGVSLTGLAIGLAPLIATFYGKVELTGITVAFAMTFLFGSAAVQHEALLRRQMRFGTLTGIELGSTLVGVACGIAMAWQGYDYWSLAGLALATTGTRVVSVFIALPWRPGLPRRRCGLRSMLRFGGTLTGSEVLHYMFRNADKVLIGWYWGAGPLGLYSRAYSVLMLVITQVNAPISDVAVSALSRLQHDAERMRHYFLNGYALLAFAHLPLFAVLLIFADEVVLLVLGSQWEDAIPLFRLLAPAAIVGALLDPLAWLFIATGRADRQIRFGLVWTVLVTAAFALGLPYGPVGVAIGFSAAACVLAVPLCAYAVRSTAVTVGDMIRALKEPAIAVILAGMIGLAAKYFLLAEASTVVRALVGGTLMLLAYGAILLGALRQWSRYRHLVRQLLAGKNAAAAGKG